MFVIPWMLNNASFDIFSDIEDDDNNNDKDKDKDKKDNHNKQKQNNHNNDTLILCKLVE